MNKNIKYSQNFLTSEKVLNQIIKQLNLKETDTVYEIGTGKGHLTTKLAKISKQVTSIELDSHLFNLSSEKLKLNTRVTLIHQDILQFQFPNKQLKEAQERKRLENENRQLKVQVEYLEKDLSWERGISARLQEGIGAVLDFLDQHLPEQFRPLVEKARELLPVPEVQQPEREQERGHTWGGMEL